MEKIHGDPKIGDISHKYNTVVNMQFVAGVVVSLIICIALLMSSGVSKAMGAPLPAEPKSLESGGFLKGKYTPAKRENPTYRRCATLEGFSARQQSALEALGITQEDVN